MVTWVRDVSVDKRARGVKFESLPPSPVLLLALSVGSGLALKVARVGLSMRLGRRSARPGKLTAPLNAPVAENKRADLGLQMKGL